MPKSPAAPITWTTETRRLGDLKPWARNPRQTTQEQAERLKRSLRKFDYSQLYEIEPDNTILDGHQRDALMQLMTEWGENAVIEVRVASRLFTLDERKEYIALKHQGAQGEWNWDAMHNLYEGDELLDFGFAKDDLEFHEFDFNGDEPPEDPGAEVDRAKELREKWGVKRGDLWRLGDHLLICGDCTDPLVVAALMGGERYDSMITDPPFFTPATHYQSRIKHQRKFSDLSALGGFMELVLNVTGKYGKLESHVVIFCNCDSYAVFYPVVFSRFDKTKSLVWDKGHVGLGRIFRHQHELMIWGRNAGHYYEPDGVLYADVMTYEATLSKDREHPVEKPIALISNLLSPLTPKSGIVLDPFLGSGSTMLAAEKMGRKCYSIDMDAGYCAVALERWLQMTGREPELVTE